MVSYHRKMTDIVAGQHGVYPFSGKAFDFANNCTQRNFRRWKKHKMNVIRHNYISVESK